MDQAEAAAAARDNYDRMAQVYTDHVSLEATVHSIALAGLGYFAHMIEQAGAGPVADVGCGPGHITCHLDELGLDVFGVDVSPALLQIATTAYPHLRFEAGELAALPIDDNCLQGVVSKHSLIHTPAKLVPAVLDEFVRVLMPGGLLYLSFFGAEEPATHGEPFDHAVTTAYRFDIDAMATALTTAGLIERVRIVRQPKKHQRQLPFAMLCARLPLHDE